MMKAFLKIVAAFAVAGASFVASTALAQTENGSFRIAVIREASSAELIQVGRDWRKDLPKRILVTLRVQENLPQAGVVAKAYFYDKDYNLVYPSAAPNAVLAKTGKGGRRWRLVEASSPPKFKVASL